MGHEARCGTGRTLFLASFLAFSAVLLASSAAAEPGDVRIVPSAASEAERGAAWPLDSDSGGSAPASNSAPAPAPAPAPNPVRAAEAAAAEAEQVAREARAYAESVAAEAERKAALEAERQAALEALRAAEIRARAAVEAATARENERAAEPASSTSTSTSTSGVADGAPVTSADLEAAVEQAEQAADDAWIAARAAERAAQDREYAVETGPYLGVAFVYGAEEFDDDLVIKSSLGAAGIVGWRISPFFATELRLTAFDGFDIQAGNGQAEIDGYAVTLNAKVYPFQTRIQPFIVLGIGGIQLESDTRLDDGRRFKDQEADGLFRIGAGLDLPLSDYLSLTLEAAYLAPTDGLTDFDVTELSTGVVYRF
ncbi:MAG: porin family protein [Myxococcota bacterium]